MQTMRKTQKKNHTIVSLFHILLIEKPADERATQNNFIKQKKIISTKIPREIF